jgi:hypothetical protein
MRCIQETYAIDLTLNSAKHGGTSTARIPISAPLGVGAVRLYDGSVIVKVKEGVRVWYELYTKREVA